MNEIQSSKKPISALFYRFHLVIFTVIIVLLLSVAILLLSRIAGKASGEDSLPQTNTSLNFDQATIDRIGELKTSGQQSDPLDLSEGRINPFGE